MDSLFLVDDLIRFRYCCDVFKIEVEKHQFHTSSPMLRDGVGAWSHVGQRKVKSVHVLKLRISCASLHKYT